MTYRAADFAGRQRDSRWERELSSWLRSRVEAERYSFLDELYDIHPIVALDLAYRTLAEPDSFAKLLDRGLRESDASSIRFWLDCVIPRLGFRRVVRLLHLHLRDRPLEVEKTLYWLLKYANSPGYSREAANELRDAVQQPQG